MKKQFRLGFTLVELLVVISIIGMLAGLLLPAVNAAREAGRRAVCMNNQSQLALALINYDSARNSLPPLRGEVGKRSVAGTGENATPTDLINVTSWVGFLLPYMEYNQLYQNLSNVVIHDDTAATANSALYYDKQLIRIKSLLCPSSDPPQTDLAPTHYVANGGYQNAVHTDWASAPTKEWATNTPFEPGRVSDAVFFDYIAYSTATTKCNVKCSIDYISSHSGTSNVILLSENERAITDGGKCHQWGRWDSTNKRVWAYDESYVGFCYPYNTNNAGSTKLGTLADFAAYDGIRLAEAGDDTKWSFCGYAVTVEEPNLATTDYKSEAPVWINIARGDAYTNMNAYRRARPASSHPGIVMAAFADRSVRPVLETVNKRTFVWLCQPNSGNVVSAID